MSRDRGITMAGKERMMSLFHLYGMAAGADMERGRSGAAEGAAARAESRAQRVETQLRRLEANLAKALLINEALWEIIRDQHGLRLEDLHKRLYEIDMRDGQLDGKNQRKPAPCPQCGRTVSARHAACLYCGCVMDTSVFTVD